LRFPGIPEEAQETFALIERAAREALSETRGIVGLLRGEGERVPAGGGALSAPTAQGTRAPPSAHGGELAPTSPAPSIESIPDLVDAARSGGMPVSLAMSGSTLGIADSTALAAYRMVQEGLANAATHAPGAPVQVEIVRQGAGLRVAILNGPPPGGEP
jgi:signal transduction histidine kinase